MPLNTNFSYNDAYRIINNVIDERINMLTGSAAGVEYTWGTVASIDTPYLCSVTLYGNTDPSGGFRIENGMTPNVLDPVRVAMDKRGNRWIEGIISDSTATYNKLEIDPRDGEIRVGDGTAAPTALTGTKIIAEKASTDLVTAYPVGLSTFSSTAANGWPLDTCMVTTIKYNDARIMQFVSSHNGGGLYWRIGHSSAFGTNLFDPNFTPLTPMNFARVRLSAIDDVGLASTTHALQIGPTSGGNLAFDGNEIMSRNNGAIDSLNLNADGGVVTVNQNAGAEGLRVMRGGLAIGTTSAPTDDLSLRIGADAEMRRIGANLLGMSSGDTFYNNAVGRRVIGTSAASIPANSVWTKLTAYTSTTFTGLLISYGTGTFTVTAAGLYMVVGKATFTGSTGGTRRIIGIGKNGADPVSGWDVNQDHVYITAGNSFDIAMNITSLVDLAAGDTVALWASQNHTSAINISQYSLSIAMIGV